MRLPLPNSGLSVFGQCILLYPLLGNVLIDAIAIPVDNGRLQDRDLASSSASIAVRLNSDLAKKAQPIVARAGVPLKPKPKPKPDPADPVTGPPLQHNNPGDSNPPPPLHQNNPADPKLPPAGQPDHLVPPPAEKPKTPANPKPDPKGPIPTEEEITSLHSVPKDKSLFWSGTDDKVYGYRDKAGLRTDEDAYPPGYTDTFWGIDPVKNDEFAHRFSRVFAREAQGEVQLMVPWETGPNPTRYFHTDEWPILKEGLSTGRITKIIQVNPNNWAETRIYDPTIYGLTRRTTEAEIDMDNVPWDVNLDALAEAWKRANKK